MYYLAVMFPAPWRFAELVFPAPAVFAVSQLVVYTAMRLFVSKQSCGRPISSKCKTNAVLCKMFVFFASAVCFSLCAVCFSFCVLSQRDQFFVCVSMAVCVFRWMAPFRIDRIRVVLIFGVGEKIGSPIAEMDSPSVFVAYSSTSVDKVH